MLQAFPLTSASNGLIRYGASKEHEVGLWLTFPIVGDAFPRFSGFTVLGACGHFVNKCLELSGTQRTSINIRTRGLPVIDGLQPSCWVPLQRGEHPSSWQRAKVSSPKAVRTVNTALGCAENIEKSVS